MQYKNILMSAVTLAALMTINFGYANKDGIMQAIENSKASAKASASAAYQTLKNDKDSQKDIAKGLAIGAASFCMGEVGGSLAPVVATGVALLMASTVCNDEPNLKSTAKQTGSAVAGYYLIAGLKIAGEVALDALNPEASKPTK